MLAAGSLEEAEREEAGAETPEEEIEERVLEEIRSRGRLPNLSTFAFTAILDVLGRYSTYKAYWRLLKKIEDDPRYDRRKAEHLLKSFVELRPHAIGEKVAVCVEHFAAQVAGEIGGRAKAMIVTRSRLHAVRTKIALDGYLAEKGHPWQALVAFSGTVTDDEFMRHLAEAVRDGLGDRAGTCIDPKTQIVDGMTVCLVSCQRSPEPVYLRWKGLEKTNGGDLHVRTGPASVRLAGEDAAKYVATRFASRTARSVADPRFPSPRGRTL